MTHLTSPWWWPPSPSLPDLSQLPGVKIEAERDDDQDSAFVSNGAGGDCDSDFEEVDKPNQRRVSGSEKSKIAAFLPPRHLLWSWADVGKKLTRRSPGEVGGLILAIFSSGL